MGHFFQNCLCKVSVKRIRPEKIMTYGPSTSAVSRFATSLAESYNVSTWQPSISPRNSTLGVLVPCGGGSLATGLGRVNKSWKKPECRASSDLCTRKSVFSALRTISKIG